MDVQTRIGSVTICIQSESPGAGKEANWDGPQVTFASESFIDELAAAAKADPVDFRLKLIEEYQEDSGFKRARSIACIKAAAEKFGWDPRPSPNPKRGTATSSRSQRR